MGAMVMLYVLPMMLGQTYDAGKDSPGIQIFPDNVFNDSVRIEHFFTDSQYRMVDNSKDIRDFLSVEGKLSLKIKGGMIDVSGEGSYLKDSSSRDNSLEILVKVHFETVTFTIPSLVKPRSDWTLENEQFLGTHYCRSITYGGDLIASIRFIATNSFDKERIRGAIQGGLNAKGIDAEVKAQLEKLKREVQDGSSMEIDYYSSVPIPGVSYTIEGLMKLVDEFPNHVRKVNDGFGKPLRMELYPLSSLKDTFPTYIENRALNDKLDDLEDQFDDLRTTKREISVWMSSLPPVIPEKIQNKIEEFSSKVEDIFTVYMDSIGKLDLSVHASVKPIDNAFAAYRDSGNSLPEKYLRNLKKMQEEIYEEAPELRPKIGGASYIHWGKKTCSSSEDVAISLTGVSISSEVVQDGGSCEFSCSALNPTFKDTSEYFKNFKKNSEQLFVGPIRYRGELKKFKPMYDKTIACAICRATQRTASVILHATTACPEGWTKEYQGMLMAPGQLSSKGQYICLDNEMEAPDSVTFGNKDEIHSAEVQEVTISCGSLPCGPYKTNTPLPCVVCTKQIHHYLVLFVQNE